MELSMSSCWLMNNAGPVIRYRTAMELLDEKEKARSLETELLSNSLVRFWLGNLQPNFDRNALHGAKTEAYENIMGKLFEFGLKKGTRAFDIKTEPFRRTREILSHMHLIDRANVFRSVSQD